MHHSPFVNPFVGIWLLRTVAKTDSLRTFLSLLREVVSEYGVDYELLYPGAFTMLKVRLQRGEMIKAESDAMVAMSNTVDVEGKLEGGVLGGLGRMLSGD